MTGQRKPSAAEKRLNRVRSAFSAEDLIRVCETAPGDFGSYAPRIDLPPDRLWKGASDRFYYYRDRGSPILAVAHLDHVQDDATCRIVDTHDGPLVLSGALDDRLGAYVILEMLPRLGIEVDWLLTTDEEMGASTAKEFYVDHKQYHWMIEFDRGGTDVVLYQYENLETRAMVREADAYVGVGSYSDIADLAQLGCAGFNWGVGYQDYHSRRSHAWLEDTFRMVAKFMKFYALNRDYHIPFDVDEDEIYGGLEVRCKVCNSKVQDGWCFRCDFGEIEDAEDLSRWDR